MSERISRDLLEKRFAMYLGSMRAEIKKADIARLRDLARFIVDSTIFDLAPNQESIEVGFIILEEIYAKSNELLNKDQHQEAVGE